MANNHTFHCPVKGEGVAVSYCEKVHSNGMQGKPHETEDKVCALAHICFMCPFRNAVRVGGPWSHPDKMPKSEKAQEKPVKLPPELVRYALSHTIPNDMDYRRVGLRRQDASEYDDLFRNIQVSSEGPVKTATRHSGADSIKPAKKPKSAEQAMVDGYNENEMAEAVSEMAREEKRQSAPEKRKSASKQSAPAKQPRRSQNAAQSVPDASKKPMSLAERAKLMKQRKQT